MTRLEAYRDAFDNYPLLAKVAAHNGYIPDMHNGEWLRDIKGTPHKTLRAFGHGHAVLVAHPNDGNWQAARVTIIRKDGSEGNPAYIPDPLPTIDQLPQGYWGIDTTDERMTTWINWQLLKACGMQFMCGNPMYKTVAINNGFVWLDDVTQAIRRKARVLPSSAGWMSADYLLIEDPT